MCMFGGQSKLDSLQQVYKLLNVLTINQPIQNACVLVLVWVVCKYTKKAGLNSKNQTFKLSAGAQIVSFLELLFPSVNSKWCIVFNRKIVYFHFRLTEIIKMTKNGKHNKIIAFSESCNLCTYSRQVLVRITKLHTSLWTVSWIFEFCP